MGSRHLLSYSHGATLLFYLFFHHPTLVYISSLPDRKVPILLSLDFLPGMVYDLYYLVVCLYLWISCQLLLISVTSDEQLCSDKSSASRTGSRPYRHGANSGFSAWARHRKDPSVDSLMSDFSALHSARPGLGDKMFESISDHGPLSSISASPPEKTDISHNLISHCTSFDSIMDDGQLSSMDDSLFEKTGQQSSMSSDSVFGDDLSHPYEGGLLPPNQFRQLSVMSVSSVHSPMREDDTMISVCLSFLSFDLYLELDFRCLAEDMLVDSPSARSLRHLPVYKLKSELKSANMPMARTAKCTRTTNHQTRPVLSRSPQSLLPLPFNLAENT